MRPSRVATGKQEHLLRRWPSQAVTALATILVAVAAAGCGGQKTTTPAAPAASTPLPSKPVVSQAEPGQSGGRLVIANIGDPKTFNPITANESSSRDVIRYMFSSLVNVDTPTQRIDPGLAESWTVADDQLTWTFKLREGLRWSDGQPLTAEDVAFTWAVIYNPEINNVVSDLFRIDGKNFEVTKVDALTIRVTTPAPYAPFLEYFGSVPVIPKHVLEPAVKEKQFESAYGINTPPEKLVGSGPYVVKQFRPNQYTLVTRNPHYFVVDSKGGRLPYFDEVIYTVVPDMNAMSLRFLKGESDVHENVRPDEYERFKAEADKGRFQLFDLGMGLERAFLWFNQNTNLNASSGKPIVNPTRVKWFRDTRFRQAISHAIDRDSIVRSVYAGRARPNYGFTGPENPKWFNPQIPTFPFNQDRSRALLAEMGIRDRNNDGLLEDADGNVVEFVMNTNTGNNVRERTSVLVQEDLKRIGIRLIFQPVEFNTLVDKISNSYDYECILMGLGGGAIDPASSMNVLLSSGFTHTWFPRQKSPSTPWEARIDELMNLQIKTLDFAQRKKYFDEVQAILAEQQPMIYTVTPLVYAAARSDLGNLRPTPLSTYRVTWNVEEMFFKK